MVLTGGGGYEGRQHDTIIFKGHYTLRMQKDCYGDEKRIHFTSDNNSWYSDSYISIDSDGKLVFSSSNCFVDGGSSTFHKIGN